MRSVSKSAEAVFRLAIERLAGGDHVKIDSGRGYMPLVVESIGGIAFASYPGKSFRSYSFAHYYEQNGDMMRDPEVVFVDFWPGMFAPVMYRQDGFGVDHDCLEYDEAGLVRGVRVRMQADTAKFCHMWARNLQMQQELWPARKTVPVKLPDPVTAVGRVGIKAVALNRAEGPSDDCYAVVFHTAEVCPGEIMNDRHFRHAAIAPVKADQVVEEVTALIREWSKTSPDTGGYDKTDFMVIWENGESYAGRFDMQKGGTDGGETFWASLRGRVAFYACRRRPAHFTDTNWACHCKNAETEGYKQQMEKVLTECYIPAA